LEGKGFLTSTRTSPARSSSPYWVRSLQDCSIAVLFFPLIFLLEGDLLSFLLGQLAPGACLSSFLRKGTGAMQCPTAPHMTLLFLSIGLFAPTHFLTLKTRRRALMHSFLEPEATSVLVPFFRNSVRPSIAPFVAFFISSSVPGRLLLCGPLNRKVARGYSLPSFIWFSFPFPPVPVFIDRHRFPPPELLGGWL